MPVDPQSGHKSTSPAKHRLGKGRRCSVGCSRYSVLFRVVAGIHLNSMHVNDIDYAG